MLILKKPTKTLISLMLIITIIVSFISYPVHADALSLAIGGYVVDEAIFIFGLKAAAVLAVTYGAYKFSQSDMAYRIAKSIHNMSDSVKDNIKQLISSGNATISSSDYEKYGIDTIVQSLSMQNIIKTPSTKYVSSGDNIVIGDDWMTKPYISNLNAINDFVSTLSRIYPASLNMEIDDIEVRTLYYGKVEEKPYIAISDYSFHNPGTDITPVKSLFVDQRINGQIGFTYRYTNIDGKLYITDQVVEPGDEKHSSLYQIENTNIYLDYYAHKQLKNLAISMNISLLELVYLHLYTIENGAIRYNPPYVKPVNDSVPVPKSISLQNSLDLEIDGYNVESDNLIDLEATGIKTRIEEENPLLTDTTDLPLSDNETENPEVPSNPELTGILGILNSILTFIKSILEFIRSIFEFPDDVSIDFSPLSISGLKDRFPFSIPFDLYNAIKIFSSSAKQPVFKIDLDTSYFKLNYTIDITPYVFYIMFFRYVAVAWFSIYLICKTRDLIKW